MNAPIRHVDPAQPRFDWTLAEIEALFERPFMELVFEAAAIHRRWFDPSEVQLSQLLSVKTGGHAGLEVLGLAAIAAVFGAAAGLHRQELRQLDL